MLLFPYVLKGEKIELIHVDKLKKDYPLAYTYLNKLKNDLTKRKIETTSNNFYKYSAARSLTEYNNPKIMIPDMLVSIRISYDKEGKFYHGPAIHSVVFNEKAKTHNVLAYLAILNSKLFWFFISNTSTALRGNAFRLTPEFIDSFCFPDFDIKENKLIHDKLISLTENMMSLSKELYAMNQTDNKRKIEEQLKQVDQEIDDLVYKMYKINNDERKIIENTGEL
jgi:adenine-specific DNA-methyltransferase